MYKMLVHIWPGNKLSSGMTETDKVTGWCSAEFRAKLSPTVELNRLPITSQMCSMGEESGDIASQGSIEKA